MQAGFESRVPLTAVVRVLGVAAIRSSRAVVAISVLRAHQRSGESSFGADVLDPIYFL